MVAQKFLIKVLHATTYGTFQRHDKGVINDRGLFGDNGSWRRNLLHGFIIVCNLALLLISTPLPLFLSA